MPLGIRRIWAVCPTPSPLCYPMHLNSRTRKTKADEESKATARRHDVSAHSHRKSSANQISAIQRELHTDIPEDRTINQPRSFLEPFGANERRMVPARDLPAPHPREKLDRGRLTLHVTRSNKPAAIPTIFPMAVTTSQRRRTGKISFVPSNTINKTPNSKVHQSCGVRCMTHGFTLLGSPRLYRLIK